MLRSPRANGGGEECRGASEDDIRLVRQGQRRSHHGRRLQTHRPATLRKDAGILVTQTTRGTM